MKKYYKDDNKDYLSGKFEGLMIAKIIAYSLGDDGKLCDRDFIVKNLEKECMDVYNRLVKLKKQDKKEKGEDNGY